PLAERAIAKEADGHAIESLRLAGERGAGGDACAAADDGVGAQIAGRLVGDVHAATLAVAVACLLAQQFSEHQVNLGALGDAVAVAAMRAGDVVILPQRSADADGDRFLSAIEV